MGIETLVEDLYQAVANRGTDTTVTTTFSARKKSDEVEPEPVLRFSSVGTPCSRKLWYAKYYPEELIPFDPATLIKFDYGHLLEEYLLDMAASLPNHTVLHRQLEVSYKAGSDTPEEMTETVYGHIDAIIDGCLVDVKTAGNFAFQKFKKNSLGTDDPFGYLTQLNLYAFALFDHPDLIDKRYIYFLVINKETGELHLDRYETSILSQSGAIDALESHYHKLKSPSTVPARRFEDVSMGSKGNRTLGTVCTYCNAKRICWPGLRAFKYAKGVTYLTHVAEEPKVPEVNLYTEELE